LQRLGVPLAVAWVSPSQVESDLKKLYRTLQKVSDELDYITANAKAGATYLHDRAKRLSILVQRGIHRKNLNIAEAQLAQQQSALPKDALQTLIQPFLDQEQEKVQALEEKDDLDPYKQRLLPIHRQNVELYQQMLTGERPYAPLVLLNQIIFQEEALKDIDTKLAH
jgi:hypothetical protein